MKIKIKIDVEKGSLIVGFLNSESYSSGYQPEIREKSERVHHIFLH